MEQLGMKFATLRNEHVALRYIKSDKKITAGDCGQLASDHVRRPAGQNWSGFV